MKHFFSFSVLVINKTVLLLFHSLYDSNIFFIKMFNLCSHVEFISVFFVSITRYLLLLFCISFYFLYLCGGTTNIDSTR